MTTAVRRLTITRDARYDGFAAKALDLTGKLTSAKVVEPGDLEIINSYAVKAMTADEVAVYEGRIANNQIDRDGERFSEEVLADFADSLPGKSLMVGHDWGGIGVGRFFKAEVVTDDAGTMWLIAKCYLVRADADAQELIPKLDGGVAWAMSIGFTSPDRVYMTGRDGSILYAEYRRGPNSEPAEALEASLVFLGAQYDAAIAKSAAGQMEAHVREKAGAGKGAAVPRQIDKKGILAKVGELLDGIFGPGEMVPAEPAAAAELPAKTTAAAKGKKGGHMPDGAPCSCDPADSDYNPDCRCEKEDEVMDVKLEELKSALKSEFEALLAPFQGALAELKAAMTQGIETLKEIGGRLDVVEKAAEDAEVIAEKMLERLEGVEAQFSAPKGQSDGELGGGDAGKVKKVFGNAILPREFHR